jgi:hypothetical protein
MSKTTKFGKKTQGILEIKSSSNKHSQKYLNTLHGHPSFLQYSFVQKKKDFTR